MSDRKPETLRQAAALYLGDLLEGLLVQVPVFEGWLLMKRERLRMLATTTWADLLASAVERGQHDRAAEAARQILPFDPFREAACRTLMQMQAERVPRH